MLLKRRQRNLPRIVLISLVDVIFLLLFFFLLTSRLADADQIELNASKAETKIGGPAKDNGVLLIHLSANSLSVNDTPVAYADIARLAKNWLPGRPVVIRTATDANIQQMVTVIDAVKLAGATEITLEGLE